MSEDILNRSRRANLNIELELSEEMRNEALILIEEICMQISGNTLNNLGMNSPDREMHQAFNRELERERDYDIETLSQTVRESVPKLNMQQKNVYETMMNAIRQKQGGMYFLDAPGGTGKTFLISLLLATVRSRSDIAVAVASSGIAATLLEGGRTAHSAFKLPLNLQVIEEPTCNISKNSAMAKVLQKSEIIIWDECTMSNKKALEALDRTMRDLRNSQRIFGGALILLSGDFRQTLPIIPRSTVADVLNACLKYSYLWRNFKKLKLTTNMRVAMQNDQSAEIFSKQLLKIGNGEVIEDKTTSMINFPENFCNMSRTKEELIKNLFPNIESNYKNQDWLSARAILAAKNTDVDGMNDEILKKYQEN